MSGSKLNNNNIKNHIEIFNNLFNQVISADKHMLSTWVNLSKLLNSNPTSIYEKDLNRIFKDILITGNKISNQLIQTTENIHKIEPSVDTINIIYNHFIMCAKLIFNLLERNYELGNNLEDLIQYTTPTIGDKCKNVTLGRLNSKLHDLAPSVQNISFITTTPIQSLQRYRIYAQALLSNLKVIVNNNKNDYRVSKLEELSGKLSEIEEKYFNIKQHTQNKIKLKQINEQGAVKLTHNPSNIDVINIVRRKFKHKKIKTTQSKNGDTRLSIVDLESKKAIHLNYYKKDRKIKVKSTRTGFFGSFIPKKLSKNESEIILDIIHHKPCHTP